VAVRNPFEEQFETPGEKQPRLLLATVVFAIVTANLSVLVRCVSHTPSAFRPVLAVSAVYRLL